MRLTTDEAGGGEITAPLMGKAEAQQHDENIIKGFNDIGAELLLMRNGRGYEALGHKSFQDYGASIEERTGSRAKIYRLMQTAEVEQNISGAIGQNVKISGRAAEVLSRLPIEGQAEVYAEVNENGKIGTEKKVEKAAERWMNKHGEKKPAKKKTSKDASDGWTNSDLKEDEELSVALDRIQKVYDEKSRKSIQNGTIGLSRSDILGLAALHATKMKELENLIMVNRWNVPQAVKFLNTTPDEDSTVNDLIDYTLATPKLEYTATINGYEITVKATRAIKSKLS